MIVLGIDPGSHHVGYGIIKQKGGSELISCGLLKYTSKSFVDNLENIYKDIEKLINEHSPDVYAIEKLFFHKNQKTLASVYQSRGVLLLAALHNNIPIIEMTPPQIKQSVAGSGRANKKAVALMVKRIIGIDSIPGPDDVSDALAVALTGAQMAKHPMYSDKFSS